MVNYRFSSYIYWEVATPSPSKTEQCYSKTKPIPNRDLPNTAELCPNFEKPVSFYLSNYINKKNIKKNKIK